MLEASLETLPDGQSQIGAYLCWILVGRAFRLGRDCNRFVCEAVATRE